MKGGGEEGGGGGDFSTSDSVMVWILGPSSPCQV